jgi:hypothetical protein
MGVQMVCKAFVKQNWNAGFDEHGRPVMTMLQNADDLRCYHVASCECHVLNGYICHSRCKSYKNGNQ